MRYSRRFNARLIPATLASVVTLAVASAASAQATSEPSATSTSAPTTASAEPIPAVALPPNAVVEIQSPDGFASERTVAVSGFTTGAQCQIPCRVRLTSGMYQFHVGGTTPVQALYEIFPGAWRVDVRGNGGPAFRGGLALTIVGGVTTLTSLVTMGTFLGIGGFSAGGFILLISLPIGIAGLAMLVPGAVLLSRGSAFMELSPNVATPSASGSTLVAPTTGGITLRF